MNVFCHYFLALLGRSISGAVMQDAWRACRAHFTVYEIDFSETFWIGFIGCHREEVELWIIEYAIKNDL